MSSATNLVGVRELRQNLSRYLRRVDAGETLCVTERGVPVAVLAPPPARQTTVQRLVASGRVRRAPQGDLLAVLSPLVKTAISTEGSKALEQQREERSLVRPRRLP